MTIVTYHHRPKRAPRKKRAPIEIKQRIVFYDIRAARRQDAWRKYMAITGQQPEPPPSR
ncbi:MAG: hypothetical protein ACLPKW_08830 [Acetobacteraceae bacterium]|jgi:hypothetical protein